MADSSAEVRALPESGRRLRLTFPDGKALRAEYARNLRKGGAFVPTREHFEMRELVEVILELPYADTSMRLAAEVVLCLPPEAVAPGGEPGVAVQFHELAEALRERLEPLLGPPEEEPAEDRELPSSSVDDAPLAWPDAEPSSAQPEEPLEFDPAEAEASLELDAPQDEPDLEFDSHDLAAFEPSPSAAGLDPDPEPAPEWGGREQDAIDAPPAPEPAPVPSRPVGGAPAPMPPSLPLFHDERRDSPREVARVPVWVESATGLEIEARTRDLSHSGALLTVEGMELPLGRRITMRFVHPVSGKTLEVAGRPVRHLQGEGTIPAAAVRFEPEVGDSEERERFIEEIQQLEEERRREGIRGPIEEVGVANLLQMFASCSPRGTVALSQGAEEGIVMFDGGRLLLARLGSVVGIKALARMLTWRDGHFEFHSHVDASAGGEGGEPLEAALLDAMRQIDEGRELALPVLSPGARFAIEREHLTSIDSPLGKIDEAVLELAAAGFTVRRIFDVIPETDAQIHASIAGLLERGILSIPPES